MGAFKKKARFSWSRNYREQIYKKIER